MTPASHPLCLCLSGNINSTNITKHLSLEWSSQSQSVPATSCLRPFSSFPHQESSSAPLMRLTNPFMSQGYQIHTQQSWGLHKSHSFYRWLTLVQRESQLPKVTVSNFVWTGFFLKGWVSDSIVQTQAWNYLYLGFSIRGRQGESTLYGSGKPFLSGSCSDTSHKFRWSFRLFPISHYYK